MLWYIVGACLLAPTAALFALEHRSRCRYEVPQLRGRRVDRARPVLAKSWLLYLLLMEAIFWLPGAGVLGTILAATNHDSLFRATAVLSFVGSALGTGIWLSMRTGATSGDPSEAPTVMLQGKRSLSLRLYIIRWHTQFGQEFSSSDKTNLRNYLEALVDNIMSQRQYDGVELRRRLRTSFKTYVDTYGTPETKADDDWKRDKVASVVANRKKSDRQATIDCFECATWRGASYDARYIDYITRNFDSLFLQ